MRDDPAAISWPHCPACDGLLDGDLACNDCGTSMTQDTDD